MSLLWSPFCLISCQWGGKELQRQKVSVTAMALLRERNSDEILQKGQDVWVWFSLVLDHRDAIEAAAEKPSSPAFMMWRTAEPAQVRAEERKLPPQSHAGEEAGLHGHDPRGVSPCGRRLTLTL